MDIREIDLEYYFGDIPEKTEKKLKGLLEKYIEIFDYNPSGDMLFEFRPNMPNKMKIIKKYMSILEKCIQTKRDIYDVCGVGEDDDV